MTRLRQRRCESNAFSQPRTGSYNRRNDRPEREPGKVGYLNTRRLADAPFRWDASIRSATFPSDGRGRSVHDRRSPGRRPRRNAGQGGLRAGVRRDERPDVHPGRRVERVHRVAHRERREDAVGHGHVSELFYPDGRRADTLADKVLDAPETADEAYGVERCDSAR
ncbi:MAG: hypothetical protein R6U98_36975, partial [Pirellulaceae bacterium]